METAMTDTATMPAVFVGHDCPMNTLEHRDDATGSGDPS